jgi:hypothetical protein
MSQQSLGPFGAVCLSALLGIACQGLLIEPPAEKNSPGAPGGPGSGGSGAGAGAGGGSSNPAFDARFRCGKPELRGHGQTSMRRLTRDEFLKTVEAVVGSPVLGAEAVQRAAARIPPESPGDLVATFQNGHAFDHVEGFLLTGQAIAAQVAQDPATRARVFGSCAEQADAACALRFLDSTALGLLRRPLDSARKSALLTAFSAEGGGLKSMEWLLARILQSPEMVFHLELPTMRCTVAPDAAPLSFAWNDASVFFAPNGAARTGPQQRITTAGWYVWEIPGTRVTSACTKLSLDLSALSDDGSKGEIDVNLNDMPVLADVMLDPGSRTVEANVSLPAGGNAKVGVYFANAGAGRALEFHSLSLTKAAAPSECVEEPPVQGLFKVDPWTVASRVAYALTGTGPDRELLDAAAAGTLTTDAEVRPHAERLLGTSAAREQLGMLLDSWLNLSAIPQPNRTIATLAGIGGEGLSEEARQELIEYVSYLVFDRDADTRTLMSEKIGFPRSERMAKLYGTSVVTGDAPVALGRGHGGMLLRIAPLLSGQLSSSPILRGVYVRKRILCDVLPSPDFTIVNTRVQQFEAMSHQEYSTREIVTAITSEGACPTCHQQINPIGFTLERFDPLGQPRTEEIVYSSEGIELARHPIDPKVTAANLEAGLPERLNGAEELNQALAQSGKVRACIAERLVTQARLRPRAAADDCALAEVEQALRSGASVREAWIRAVVNAELFVRATEASP